MPHAARLLALLVLAAGSLTPLPGYPLSMSLLAGTSFGLTEFTGNPASGDVTMGTNGSITYGTSFSGGGSGTAGQVLLADTVGTQIDLRCSATSTLAVGGNTLTAHHAIILGSSNVGAYPSALPCQGDTTTVTTYTITGTAADDTVYIGTVLNTDGQTLASGAYSTTHGGGSDFTLTAIII